MKTSILTPMQVKEAVVAWARANGLCGTYEEIDLKDVTIKADGSAAIKRKVQT